MAYVEDLRLVARFRGLTIRDVAEKVGITEKELLSQCAEGLTPPAAMDQSISEILDIPAGSLLEGKVRSIPLCTGIASSRKRFYLKSFFETLSIASVVLIATVIIGFCVLSISCWVTDMFSENLGVIFGIIADGFLLFLLIYFGYRFGPSRLFGKDGPVSATMTLGGIQLSGLKGITYYRYDDLGGGRLLESRYGWVMTPSSKPFIGVPKEGLSEQEIAAVRRLFNSSVGAYCCAVRPTARNGFNSEEEVVFATRSYKRRLGWIEMTSSVCLLAIAGIIGFVLVSGLIPDSLLICGGASLLSAGVLYLGITRPLVLPRRMGVLSWVATGIIVSSLLAGIVLLVLGSVR